MLSGEVPRKAANTMEAAYAERYRRLYEEHWWWRAREAMVLDLLERLGAKGDLGHILDVGCGDGLFFDRLRDYGEPEGVEVDARTLSDVGRRSGRIHVCPFDSTFEPGHRFGLILMLDVIEHLDDDRSALTHAARLLRPGGWLLVTVPAFSWLWTQHDEWNHHRRRYTKSSLERVAEDAGFEVAESFYFFHWLVPLKLLVRVIETFTRSRSGPPSVPSRPANSLCLTLSSVENRLFAKLRLPFGSSIAVVLVHADVSSGAGTGSPATDSTA